MEKQKEIEYLGNRMIYIMNFMAKSTGNKEYFQHHIDLINAEVERKNLRGLRIASKDTDSWAKALPKADLVELDQQLKAKFGDGLLGNTAFNRKVNAILNRGKINNIKEFELIHNLTQDIAEGDEQFEYMEQLQGLLVAYMRDNP